MRSVGFDVHAGETVGLVGESGSGKSMTMLSVAGLVPNPPARISSGEVVFEGTDLLSLDEEGRRATRGSGIAMIFQDPMSSLNPLMRIGEQIIEGMPRSRHSQEPGGGTNTRGPVTGRNSRTSSSVTVIPSRVLRRNEATRDDRVWHWRCRQSC